MILRQLLWSAGPIECCSGQSALRNRSEHDFYDCTGLTQCTIRQVAENILARLDFIGGDSMCPVLSIAAGGGPLVPLDFYADGS